jgi:ABC-type bacteriocin/lantibiotic exporter with double-glycine peptidase domain
MLGGVKSMKGEKRMIYKNITFKADPFSYDLMFDDRITLVGGDSGTGKTVLYEMLEDLRLTDQYKAIKLFNYKSDNLLEAVKQCKDNFIVIDNADILINDEIRRFINFEFSNQYMLFLRNCDGLNVSDKSFKVLKLEDNRITLEEELCCLMYYNSI